MVSSNHEDLIKLEQATSPVPAKPRALELTMDAVRMPAASTERAQPLSETAVPLAHYFWLFRRNSWRIILWVLAVTFGVLAISLKMTPVYEATVTIDVDRQTPTGVIGQESNRALTNDSDQFLATQVKMLQSDSVLRPVVDRFHLPLRKPSRFRLVGNYTPEQQNAAPMVLEGLKVSRPPNTYLMLVSYRSTDPKLASETVNAIAHSYLDHTYNIRFQSSAGLSRFMEKQLDELRA
ncbi:MAG: Wzz/FepE/Etk N-terminal domain-containing protein, partial [Acidobacteria bacterium]|nr:Wzz/FepE/Etk N-terminal domain-containing protein [Acidobacteriota bacterium]